MTVSEKITQRVKDAGHKYWASDNVSQFMDQGDDQKLIEELVPHFESILDTLIIDRHNDPNSQGTARRLAKMYINELMWGRYNDMPDATAFPNDIEEGYKGMLVVRSEIQSMCSHHHQPVKGVAYIGLLAGVRVIGLSKYARIAQWCANRGTLQEELTMSIADELQKHTGTKDLAVYVQATHGCMEHRGVLAHSSLTQTTELRGQFFNPSVKQEFLDYIKMQQVFAGTRT